MSYVIVILPLIYLLTDSLAWRYYTHGGQIWSELSKVALIGLVAASVWFGTWLDGISDKPHYIIAGVLFHFVIQRIGCGIIRQGNPLYLGVGLFDRFIRFITGGTWYMYVLLLVLATFIGIHLLIKI